MKWNRDKEEKQRHRDAKSDPLNVWRLARWRTSREELRGEELRGEESELGEMRE